MRIKALTPIAVLFVVALAGCSSSSGGDSATAKKADFCKLVVAFQVANNGLSNDVIDGDPAKAKAAVQQIIGQVETLQKRAPADVKLDVDTAAEFVAQFDTLMAKYNYDLNAVNSDSAGAADFQALNSEQVSAALARLGAYTKAECVSSPTTNS